MHLLNLFCSMIGNYAYHLEIQSYKDGTMALRMLEYDLLLGIASARKVEGEFLVPLPRSCVIYIRHNGNTPDYEQASLVLPDGQTVKYHIPTVKVQEYTLDEIFEKKLYAYLPFYVMRYEKQFPKWEKDDEKQGLLQRECREALTRLARELDDSPEEFMNLLEVTRRVTDHVMRKQAALQERMDEVMGGKIWELPSDRIREEKAAERAKGIEEGKAVGKAVGKAEGSNSKLVENLENLMKNMHLTLQEACKALGITEQEYQTAKKQMQ